MKNTLKVYLSQVAQAAAARAGELAERIQTYQIEDAAELLDLGGTVDADGEIRVNMMLMAPDYIRPLDIRPVDAAAAVIAVRAEVEWARCRSIREEQGVCGAAIARAIKCVLKQIALEPVADAMRWGQGEVENAPPSMLAVLDEWRMRQDEARATDAISYEVAVTAYEAGGELPDPIGCDWRPEAAYDRACAETKRRAAAVEIARLDHLAVLAARMGGKSVRQRLAEPGGPLGLLPEDEALAIVRAATLPVGGGLWLYQKLVAADVRESCCCEYEGCEDDDCDGYGDREWRGSVSFLVSSPVDVGGLTADEWKVIQSIREALVVADLPVGEIQVHRGQCDRWDCPDWPVRRVGVRVKINLDGIVVSREYGKAHENHS